MQGIEYIESEGPLSLVRRARVWPPLAQLAYLPHLRHSPALRHRQRRQR